MAESEDEMRIDKFLFNVRLFKTRTLAAEACGKGSVLINGSAVKPSRNVNAGDEISVKCNPIFRKFKVVSIIKGRVGAALVENIIKETTDEKELLRLKMVTEMGRFSFGFRDRGTGRPTKKDRRDIERFYEGDNDDDI